MQNAYTHPISMTEAAQVAAASLRWFGTDVSRRLTSLGNQGDPGIRGAALERRHAR